MSVRRKSFLTLIVVPLVMLLSVVAVGVANASRPNSPGSDHKAITVPTITISAFVFHTPATVLHGARIRVINKDAAPHSVTSDVAGKFNVSVPGHTTRFFNAPLAGTYKYHCSVHPTMHGVLHVH